MKIKYWMVCLLLVFANVACSRKASLPVEVPQAAYAAILQETVKVGDLNVTVTAIEDSRCPKNVQCVRAGEAVVGFKITNSVSTIDIQLCIGGDCTAKALEGKNVFTLNTKRYALELVEVLDDTTTGNVVQKKKAFFNLKALQ